MVRDRSTVKPGLFLQSFVVAQLVGSVIDEITAGTGLQGREFAVASSIGAWPGLTPTDLAASLGMSPTTLSAVLKRLEERGMVRRTRDPDDRRRHVLELSAKGTRAWKKANERFPVWLARVRDEMEDDPAELLDALGRFEEALRRALEMETAPG